MNLYRSTLPIVIVGTLILFPTRLSHGAPLPPPVTANPQTVDVTGTTPIPITLTGSETFPGNLTYFITSAPADGTLMYLNQSGKHATLPAGATVATPIQLSGGYPSGSGPTVTYTFNGKSGVNIDSFTFMASNGPNSSATVTLNISSCPTITVSTTAASQNSLPNGIANSSYDQNNVVFTYTDSNPNDTCTFSLTGGPPGLAISASGLLIGVPTAAAAGNTYNLTVTASSVLSPQCSQISSTYSLTVNPASSPASFLLTTVPVWDGSTPPPADTDNQFTPPYQTFNNISQLGTATQNGGNTPTVGETFICPANVSQLNYFTFYLQGQPGTTINLTGEAFNWFGSLTDGGSNPGPEGGPPTPQGTTPMPDDISSTTPGTGFTPLGSATYLYTPTGGWDAVTITFNPPAAVSPGNAYVIALTATNGGNGNAGNAVVGNTWLYLEGGLGAATQGGGVFSNPSTGGPGTPQNEYGAWNYPGFGFYGDLAFTAGFNTETPTCPTITLTPPANSTFYTASGASGFSQAFGASTTGGDTFTYAATGNVPPGMSLDPSGNFSGTAPSTPGSYTFYVTAIDANGCTVSSPYTLVVNSQLPPVAYNEWVSALVGEPNLVGLTGSDPNMPALPLTYTVTGLPTDGTLQDAQNQYTIQPGDLPYVISGSPFASGVEPSLIYTPSAVTSIGSPDSFTFAVNNGSSAPSWATVSINVIGSAAGLQASTSVSGGQSASVNLPPQSAQGGVTATLQNAAVQETLTATAIPSSPPPPGFNFTGAAAYVDLKVLPSSTLPSPPDGQMLTATFYMPSAKLPNPPQLFYLPQGASTAQPVLQSDGMTGVYGTYIDPSNWIPGYTFTFTFNDKEPAGSGPPNTATGATTPTISQLNGTGIGMGTPAPAIVCPPITLTPAASSAVIDVPFSQKITVTETPPAPPYAFSITGGPPSFNLSIDANGNITGNPTQQGAFYFTITATDASGNACSGSVNYTLIVACPTITLTPGQAPGGTSPYSLPAAIVNCPYPQQTITISGGSGDYGPVTITSGLMPPGLAFSGTSIVGTPTSTENLPYLYTFTATVSDESTGCTGSSEYTLTVGCPTITLSPLSGGALPAATAGTAYTAGPIIRASTSCGGSGSYIFSSMDAPSWLQVNSDGSLTGTPATAGGPFTFHVTATDAVYTSCPGTAEYTIVVQPSGPPTLTITANNIQTSAGGPLPPFSYTASGFVNGDGPSSLQGTPNFTITPSPFVSQAGLSYTITPSQGTLTDPNYQYQYSFVPGTLTVGPAPPSANNTCEVYDGITAVYLPETRQEVDDMINSEGGTAIESFSGPNAFYSYNSSSSATTATDTEDDGIGSLMSGSASVQFGASLSATAEISFPSGFVAAGYLAAQAQFTTYFVVSGPTGPSAPSQVPVILQGTLSASVYPGYTVSEPGLNGSTSQNVVNTIRASLTLADITESMQNYGLNGGVVIGVPSVAAVTANDVSPTQNVSSTIMVTPGDTIAMTGVATVNLTGYGNPGESSGGATGTATVDPTVTIDPSFPQASQYSIVFSGNSPQNGPGVLITWQNPADITYGTPLSGTQLNATANIPGTISYPNNPAGTVLPAGFGQTISVTFTPTDPTIPPVTQTASINVHQAPLTITANNASMPYGGPVPSLTASYNGFVNGDTAVATPPTVTTTATSTSSPGTYPITAGGASDPNYYISYAPGTLTVGPAPPVPGVNNWGTTAGQSLVVPVAKMLAGASSPSGGTLSITGVNPSSTAGGSVSLDPTGSTLTYAPPANPPTPPGTYPYTDQFTYTLFDTFATATGTVSVTVTAADQQSKNGLGTIAMSGGNPVIGFLGIPGNYYNVQWTASLAAPITWTTVATVMADPTGLIRYADMTAPMPDARFYRTVPAQ